MSDTDKYEGHTPSEWIVEEGANGDTLVSSFHPNEDGLQTDVALVYSNDIDARLIADAPLLLAEVKRLKIYERLVLCIAYHQQLPDGLYVDEELMLRAREHLRKNGEWEDEEE
jgi:hypothetical protein